MKKNKLFEERLSKLSLEIKKQVDLSFDLANLIYDIMQKENISYSELAKRLNVPDEKVELMVSGCYNFTFSDIAKLEKVLNVKLIKIEKICSG